MPGLTSLFLQPALKRGRGASQAYYDQAQRQLNENYGNAQGYVTDLMGQARNATTGGYGSARGAVTENLGQAQNYWQPWQDYGQNALASFQDWRNNPSAAMTSDPSYQFRFQQGQQALENSAAARGGALSGNALRAIADYGQQAASQEYGAEYARRMAELGLGQEATGQMAGLSSAQGQLLANLFQGEGQGLAGLYGNQAQLQSGLSANLGNALANASIGQGTNYWNQLLGSAQETRAAENDLNALIQSWFPSSGGGQQPPQKPPDETQMPSGNTYGGDFGGSKGYSGLTGGDFTQGFTSF
jgi:hypothetical protein